MHLPQRPVIQKTTPNCSAGIIDGDWYVVDRAHLRIYVTCYFHNDLFYSFLPEASWLHIICIVFVDFFYLAPFSKLSSQRHILSFLVNTVIAGTFNRGITKSFTTLTNRASTFYCLPSQSNPLISIPFMTIMVVEPRCVPSSPERL